MLTQYGSSTLMATLREMKSGCLKGDGRLKEVKIIETLITSY